MKIVLTGGGSGGHVTPLIAVAAELKRQQPDAELVFIGQRGDRFGDIVAQSEYISSSRRIFAGKFRRYHGAGWRQLLDVKTMLLNARDLVYFGIGIVQCLVILPRIKPDVVFVKGGFVGVPVGLAAAFWRRRYVTHDSDAIAGLANRIIARWAVRHAVALPESLYKNYPAAKTIRTGVPIADTYQPVTPALRAEYRRAINVPEEAELLLITGGGLGSQIINTAVMAAAPKLLGSRPLLHIIHTTGQLHERSIAEQYKALPEVQRTRIQVIAFVSDLYKYSGAADVVVARAGATNIAELAAQGVPTIVIPSPFLAGGHQLRNAEGLAEQHAVRVVDELLLRRNPHALGESITALLDDPEARAQLSKRFLEIANPEASRDLAVLLLEVAAE